MYTTFFITLIIPVTLADIAPQEVSFLNELPLDKLMKLKSSLQELVTSTDNYDNVTTTTSTYLERFGAQAMPIKAPIKRGDYEEVIHYKDHHSKISHIFSMSITTLAFLAFGGYLLCLIVQAVRAKQNYAATTVAPATVFITGLKKRPQTHFSSYRRRRRDTRDSRSIKEIDMSPDQLFSALLQVCEGYAKWSEQSEAF